MVEGKKGLGLGFDARGEGAVDSGGEGWMKGPAARRRRGVV